MPIEPLVNAKLFSRQNTTNDNIPNNLEKSSTQSRGIIATSNDELATTVPPMPIGATVKEGNSEGTSDLRSSIKPPNPPRLELELSKNSNPLQRIDLTV